MAKQERIVISKHLLLAATLSIFLISKDNDVLSSLAAKKVGVRVTRVVTTHCALYLRVSTRTYVRLLPTPWVCETARFLKAPLQVSQRFKQC